MPCDHGTFASTWNMAEGAQDFDPDADDREGDR